MSGEPAEEENTRKEPAKARRLLVRGCPLSFKGGYLRCQLSECVFAPSQRGAFQVVDGLPPLPDEVKPPVAGSAESQEVSAGLAIALNTAAEEEWLPASTAVEWAERSGHPITLKWLTRDAAKHGVRIRPRQQSGNHKKEVEWSSLAGYLLKRDLTEDELNDEEISDRTREAQEQKRKERPLD